MIPAVERIDEGDHEPGHLPWVATVRERSVVAGNDNPCRILMNYRFRLSIHALRRRLPGLLIFFASNNEAKEYQDR